MKKIILLSIAVLVVTSSTQRDVLYSYNNKVVINGKIIEVESNQKSIIINDIEYKIVK